MARPRADDDDFDEVLQDGVFIKRNLNIAPFYKQYKEEKTKVLQIVQKTKEANAKTKMERIIEQKKMYNEFYLKRWDIFREAENKRIEQE